MRQRPVRRTDSQSVSLSSGEIVRTSMTSASRPSDSAAASATCTMVPYAMIVTSRPARTICALLMGTV